MLTDYIAAEHTLDYLDYVDQFNHYSSDIDNEIDVSQILDSIQD